MMWSNCSDIFHEDGSLRDIYVHGTTLEEWDLFLSFIASSSHTLRYTIDGKINTVPECAEKVLTDSDHAHSLTIYVSGLSINCYFFTVEEIELDIDPREVKSQLHLDAILDLMTGIGSALQRDVVLTEESGANYIWLKYAVDTDEVVRVEPS